MRCIAKQKIYINEQLYQPGQEFALSERRGKAVDKKTGRLVPIVITPEMQFNPEVMESLESPKAQVARPVVKPKAMKNEKPSGGVATPEDAQAKA